VIGMDRLPALLDDELAAQTIELLPFRETLLTINVVTVIGVNIALAVNAASYNASASALAVQQLSAWQH
jgi:hypothetical protein